MTTQYVLVCSGMTTDASTGTSSCASQSWVNTYVVTPEQGGAFELLTGGFDEATFSMWFSATLTMFAIGFGIGIIISVIRKARRG